MPLDHFLTCSHTLRARRHPCVVRCLPVRSLLIAYAKLIVVSQKWRTGSRHLFLGFFEQNNIWTTCCRCQFQLKPYIMGILRGLASIRVMVFFVRKSDHDLTFSKSSAGWFPNALQRAVHTSVQSILGACSSILRALTPMAIKDTRFWHGAGTFDYVRFINRSGMHYRRNAIEVFCGTERFATWT